MISSASLLVAAFAALCVLGCSVTPLEESERGIAINSCEEKRDCGGAECVNNQCVARSGSFSTLLFEVTPVAAGSEHAPAQIFAAVGDVPAGGGEYLLRLPAFTALTGSVKAAAAIPAGCEPAFSSRTAGRKLLVATDQSLPVRATFTASERLWGLSSQSATVFVSEPAVDTAAKSYRFDAQLAAGKYDIYIEPFDAIVPMAGCVIPPLLLRGETLPGGKVSLLPTLPQPSRLSLTIRFPGGQKSITDWLVDMIEPVTGRVISTREQLQLPTERDKVLTYAVDLRYFPVSGAGAEPTGGELVRLTPPAGEVAPSLLFEREALELFGGGSTLIDLLTTLSDPVRFEGRSVDESGDPLLANVTFVATDLSGFSTQPVSFSRKVQTALDGSFSVALLPGTYSVRASAERIAALGERPFGIAASSWTVTASPPVQAGHDLVFGRSASLDGDVLVPSQDRPALGAAVDAEATLDTSPSKLYREAFGDLPATARSFGAQVDAEGRFRIFADPGRFNLFVRPPQSSGFAWLVAPGLDLGRLSAGDLVMPRQALPFPVPLLLRPELGGVLASPALTSAQVTAYALVMADGSPAADVASAQAAVPIAQAALTDDGVANLMLPRTLTFLSVQ